MKSVAATLRARRRDLVCDLARHENVVPTIRVSRLQCGALGHQMMLASEVQFGFVDVEVGVWEGCSMCVTATSGRRGLEDCDHNGDTLELVAAQGASKSSAG